MEKCVRILGIFVVCFLLLNLTKGAVAVEAKYGEECDTTNRLCNATLFQTCSKNLPVNVCECINPDINYYDAEDQICKLKVGQKCDAVGIVPKPQPCVAFSSCAMPSFGGDFRCTCFPHLTESRGQCFIPYIEDCSPTNDPIEVTGKCDTESFMSCTFFKEMNKAYCICEENDDITYDERSKSCVLLNNATCTQGDNQMNCVNGAACNEQADNPGTFKCECAGGAKPKDRQCVAEYDKECGTNLKTCDDKKHFECKSNKCVCKGGADARYDDVLDICYLKSGATCSPNGQECVPGASCPSEGGKCTCAQGLKENKNKECKLMLGDTCIGNSNGGTCDDASFTVCDPATSKCGCKNRDILEDGECKLKAFGVCSNTSQKCMKTTTCNGSSCTCNSGLSYNTNYDCVRSFNTTCGPELPGKCDSVKFHECLGGRCTCAEGTASQYSGGQCYSLLGSPCAGEDNAPCDASLTCGASGKCECLNKEEGMEDNGFGKCRKLYGASCTVVPGQGYLEGMCDVEDRYLMCQDGKCVCNTSHREKEGGKDLPCVGGRDAKCKDDKNCNADKGFHCDTFLGVCTGGSGKANLGFEFIFGASLFVILHKTFLSY